MVSHSNLVAYRKYNNFALQKKTPFPRRGLNPGLPITRQARYPLIQHAKAMVETVITWVALLQLQYSITSEVLKYRQICTALCLQKVIFSRSVVVIAPDG